MVRSILGRRIEQVVAQQDIRQVHICGDSPPERLRLHICILGGMHIAVYGIGPADRAEAQKGDQHDKNAETYRKYKERGT